MMNHGGVVGGWMDGCILFLHADECVSGVKFLEVLFCSRFYYNFVVVWNGNYGSKIMKKNRGESGVVGSKKEIGVCVIGGVCE